VATLGLAEVLSRMRPDLLLLIADRYELLAPASVALTLRIPIAHIEGGEVSEGAIDDAVRNALTKMSHLHFVPTATARDRVLAMGEEPWRVHRAGAPSLDHLRRSEIPDREELRKLLGVRVEKSALLVAYHPVTIARDTLREADAVFEALERLTQQTLFCFPNSDAGSRGLIERAGEFCSSRASSHLFVNLNPRHYWGLLRAVGAMVGNSSSGIMETASIPLPTVNVGLRQQGRERAANVIDVPVDREAIVEGVKRALDPSFATGLRGLVNPYGSGDASSRIVEVLAETPLGEELLLKRALPLRSTSPYDPPE
jgi:UDP-N-acetylglucosamine 2-epimerase (non-hydrolysing)/GDP/UDP-N,N'-diacetylbacillosamine 2-epimerase (hydrolysing)